MRRLRAELELNEKERAEHVMLVDLERNDLGRICRGGTVRVDEFMTIESYATVHHIVSNVSGELRAGVTPGEAVAAVFPGGTITGCPKVRCMELLAGLEQEPRDAYTGSMGYLGRDGTLDLNILIRTHHAARRRDRVSHWSGHRRGLASGGRIGGNSRQGPRAAARTGERDMIGRRLVNGVEASAISVDDRGLQYGDGLFETMAATNGRVRNFARHMERLAVGCDRLGIPMPDVGDARSGVRAGAGRTRAGFREDHRHAWPRSRAATVRRPSPP